MRRAIADDSALTICKNLAGLIFRSLLFFQYLHVSRVFNLTNFRSKDLVAQILVQFSHFILYIRIYEAVDELFLSDVTEVF